MMHKIIDAYTPIMTVVKDDKEFCSIGVKDDKITFRWRLGPLQYKYDTNILPLTAIKYMQDMGEVVGVDIEYNPGDIPLSFAMSHSDAFMLLADNGRYVIRQATKVCDEWRKHPSSWTLQSNKKTMAWYYSVIETAQAHELYSVWKDD